jgi:hypothetical protein
MPSEKKNGFTSRSLKANAVAAEAAGSSYDLTVAFASVDDASIVTRNHPPCCSLAASIKSTELSGKVTPSSSSR